MKRINFDRKEQRNIRHKRIKKTLVKCENTRPRLVVTKSGSHIYAQIIDDSKNVIIASSSTLTLKLKNSNIPSAIKVGEDVAIKAIAKKVTKITFDRGGNLYHGKIKALADAARGKGLDF